MSVSSLTILVPLYNEAECLPQLVKEMNQFLEACPLPASVLFINDGSTDTSQEVIESICYENSKYHFLEFEDNQGLSAAIKAGFDHCNTSLVGYIDCDCQTRPMDFLKLLDYFPTYELVTGVRAKRNDGIIKRMSSSIANSVRRWMIDDGVEDTGCPLKILKIEYAKSIPFFNGMHRFLPALVQLIGGKVYQIKVQHFPRFAGKAKYNLRNRLISPFIDAWAFRWMKNRYIHYKISRSA